MARDIDLAEAQLNAETGKYSMLLTCLGYEQRATTIAKRLSHCDIGRRIAVAFPETTIHNYHMNKKWYEENNTLLLYPETNSVANMVLDIFADCEIGIGESLRVLVDISCFSSERLAGIIEGIQRYLIQKESGLGVDFLYSLAKYTPPEKEFLPNRKIGPISPFFSGWKNDSAKDHVVIFGLGYEVDKALGVYEYLEPKVAWYFIPTSPETQYLESVVEINKELIDNQKSEQVIYYEVDSPLQTFSRLSALVRSTSQMAAPIIVPFGPKIFVLNALLVASQQFDTPVWRVGGRDLESPTDRVASGLSTGLSVEFESSVLSDLPVVIREVKFDLGFGQCVSDLNLSPTETERLRENIRSMIGREISSVDFTSFSFGIFVYSIPGFNIKFRFFEETGSAYCYLLERVD